MLSLVKQSIARRKVNSISIMLSVFLAVASIVALSLVYCGLQRGVALNNERSGAQIIVVSKEAASEISKAELLFTGVPAPIYFSKDIAEQLCAGEGIARATVQFYGQTLEEGCCSASVATRLIGIDFTTDWTVTSFAHIPIAGEIGSDKIIVGSGSGLKQGETAQVLGTAYKVADVLDETGTELDTAIMMDIDQVRKICAGQDEFSLLWDTYGSPDSIVSCVLLDVDESKISLNRVLNRINSLGAVTAIQRSDVVLDARNSLSAVFTIMLVIGILLVISSVVQLFARFYSCVWDRKSELALYRALGASAADVKKLILAELSIVLGIGLVAGVVVGLALQSALVATLLASSTFPYVAPGLLETIGITLLVVGGFCAAGLASVAWPMSQINKLQPSVAMQQADID